MRVYIPLTLPALGVAYRAGELGPAPFTAYGVTDGMREWLQSDDVEELEYAALTEAAQASTRHLADDAEAAPRRVVMAADVPDSVLALEPRGRYPRAAPGEVRVSQPVRLSRAVSVHVDDEAAEEDVAAAVGALAEAAQRVTEAPDVVDDATDHELLWYATQEIPSLL